MALVVFLRGLNVGGHRRFRPVELAAQLRHLDVVNIGAAGTFVVRKTITRARLRAEIVRRLPYDAEVVICSHSEVSALISCAYFTRYRVRPPVACFVSVLSRRSRAMPDLPMQLPAHGRWMVKVLARHGRFIVGVHRREMKVIACLGALDRVFGVRLTTRSWSTMAAITKVPDLPASRASRQRIAPSSGAC